MAHTAAPRRRPLATVAVVAFAASVATSIPYAILWARAPEGTVFLGLKAVNSADHLTYVAWMRQAVPGSLFMRNLYTAESVKPTFCLPFFWILGITAKLLGLDPILMLHLARALATVVLGFVVWWFAGVFARGPSRIRAALLLGLGTSLPGLIPEASPISACYDSVVLATSWALLLLATGLLRQGLAPRRPFRLFAAGIAASALAVVHPYDAVTFGAVAVAGTLATGAAGGLARRFGSLSITLAAFAPGCAFVAWSVLSNPLMARWAQVPRPLQLWGLLSFGILWIAAGNAIYSARDRLDPFLLAWLAVELVLVLVPSPVARRLIEGLQAPLSILATIGIESWIERGWGRFARLLEVTFYPAAVLMLMLDASGVLPVPRPLPKSLVADIQDLAREPRGVVFCQPDLGYYIPALVGRQVYAGNYGLTVDWERKLYDWDSFIDGNLTPAELARRRVSVVLAPRETDLSRYGLEKAHDLRLLTVWSLRARTGRESP